MKANLLRIVLACPNEGWPNGMSANLNNKIMLDCAKHFLMHFWLWPWSKMHCKPKNIQNINLN